MLNTLDTSAKTLNRFGIRRAFTLVELMVVIVIIGILAAATTGVVVKVIESQRRSSTQLVLDSIKGALDTQASKLVQNARKTVGGSGDVDAEINDSIINAWNLTFAHPGAGESYNSNYNKYISSYFAYTSGPYDTFFTNPLVTITLQSGNTIKAGSTKPCSPQDFARAFHLYMVLKAGTNSSMDPELLGRMVQYATVTNASQKVPYLADQWGDPIFFKAVQSPFLSPGTNPNSIPKLDVSSPNM